MIKRFLIIAYIFAKIPLMYAQDVSGFLKQVSENNPEILAFQKLLEAKKFEARTGLAPSDPFVSFGYMPGNTADIGQSTSHFLFQQNIFCKEKSAGVILSLPNRNLTSEN
jgi:hypothetical protein